MGNFFRTFFASLSALFVFCLLLFLFALAGVVGLSATKKKKVADNTVLHLDLSQRFPEHETATPFGSFDGTDIPTLYETIRLIQHAATDDNIRGIYIAADGNANGFAASNELRKALIDFQKSKKFVIAFAHTLSQEAHFVAQAAQRLYVNPAGSVEWLGFGVTLPFVKGTLDKLEIQPQIFYAGKFKSATEIFRVEKMTPENRLQTEEWLGDIYRYFLEQTAVARKKDTSSLYALAASGRIQTPQDAVAAGLIDAVKYDDEVKAEIKRNMGLERTEAFTFLPLGDYKDAADITTSSDNKIAVIYAEGDIVDGEGDASQIGGERFRQLIRKARLDEDVKAIVLRVNSGGGSALASDVIWRELQAAKTEDKKPVIVSFGDVAASGGYYIACGADSIFANPNTITGSIGVFGVVPNMEGFFKNKLGVTFDAVKTAPYADAGGVYRPLTEGEKVLIQSSVDRIYTQFKQRVAQGRKLDTAYVETVAQGRVWSGQDALRLKLVDRLATLEDAIKSAARLAKLDEYSLKEFPESENWLTDLLKAEKTEPEAIIRQQIGEENYRLFVQMKKIRQMTQSIQARLPYDILFQ